MSSREQRKEKTKLPAFPVRWVKLFRLYPQFLFDFGFILGVISGKNPVLWENISKIEKNRRARKSGASPVEKPPVRPEGIWRNDD
jgi:hypothetical protein